MFDAIRRFVNWAAALVSEDGNLSLGRVSMLMLHSAVVSALVKSPIILTALSWQAVFLLIVIYVILAAYNYGNKAWVREVLLAIICRLPSLQPVQAQESKDSGAAPEATEPAEEKPEI